MDYGLVPSDEVVVGIHGGSFKARPTLFHWFNYSLMSLVTGAKVVVPLYKMTPDGGTASTEVPKMADFVSSLIDEHGADNVSILGDSAGGTLALATAQEIYRRGGTQPQAMVLFSPGLDLTYSRPGIEKIFDPVLDLAALRQSGIDWAGGATETTVDDLAVTDPLVSPLYGSLEDLLPTYVYTGRFCSSSGLPAEPHNMQETQPSTSVPSSANWRSRM
ncbi:MAG: alpha/beta hydrolase [Mycobacterium sp.]